MKYLSLVTLFILGFSCKPTEKQASLVDYVNPLIGTAAATTESALEHGENKENNAQVVPYVTSPFGMTNWTPQTKDTEKKCLAPYYYTDSLFQGFRGSHWLSGSCVQDYGSMTIMPISGPLKWLPEERASTFSHDSEKATPYAYEVYLNDYEIKAELTATKRSGLFKFTFEKEGEAHLVLNPNSDEGEGYVKINTATNEIIGYNPVHRIYQGWGEPAGFSGYFVAQIERDFDKSGVYTGPEVLENQLEIKDQKEIGAYVSFSAKKNEVVYVKIGTSFVSIEQARKNLKAETDDLNFDQAKESLQETWENLLSKIEVEGTVRDDKVKFYTALYHSFLQPRTYNDVDGSYPSFAGGTQILNSGATDYFSDYSMWDTYRASHPLFSILKPKASADMMQSLFSMAEQGGWLPIFPCWNSYTSAMIGDHAITTIADAYMKDLIDISDKQYSYLLKNAFESPDTFDEYKNGKGRRALDSYLKHGFIPLEDKVLESFHKGEQVSRTLEYAFDDFALSQIAMKKGDTKNAEILRKRARNYANVYSPADSTVKGKFENGTFTKNYKKYTRMPYITEGTPYQYTWYVPHDIAGLMDIMGGEDAFNDNLDRFHAEGQYWHGNEPGHQIPFLYNYSGQAWKTQKLVSDIMRKEYSAEIGGLSGNDDAGQMSAWYVFAAMGFYHVSPSVPEYVISGPKFDKLTLSLESGNKLIINAPGASKGKIYIKSLTYNGKEMDKTFLSHFDLMNGGELNFEMSDVPNKEWGKAANTRPFSLKSKKP